MAELSPIELKLDRARYHIANIEQDAAQFFQQNPAQLMHEYDEEHQEHRLFVEKCTPPPQYLGVLVGEVLHQLRSSLDHAVYRLVLSNGNTPTAFTEFPVFYSKEKYESGQGAAKKVAGVSDAAREVIEDAQPFNSSEPTRNLLWVVHRLNNMDKHRHLLLTTGGAGLGPEFVTVTDKEIVFARIDRLLGFTKWSTEERMLLFWHHNEDRGLKLRLENPLPGLLLLDDSVKDALRQENAILDTRAWVSHLLHDAYVAVRSIHEKLAPHIVA